MPETRTDSSGAPMPVSFLIGTGRSGTTILYKLMSEHPQVSWVSYSLTKYPHRPHYNNLALAAQHRPVFSKIVKKYFKPAESYPFWNTLYPGFAEPCRDLLAGDVNQKITARFHSGLSRLVSPSRPHFMAKITGWPRTGFLQAIFPNAKFVHIVRDGRSVAASLLNVDWWLGWRGPANWRWGELSEEHRLLWEKYDRSFVALAGIQWIILMDAFAEASKLLGPDNLLEIRYEKLCEDTAGTMRSIADFLGVSWDQTFANRLSGYKLRNTNYKWEQDLSNEQAAILNDVLAEKLAEWGYA